MKILLLIISLQLSFTAFSQSIRDAYKDSVYLDRPNLLHKPVFVIDDVVTDSLNAIKPDEIFTISVLKGRANAKRYGKKDRDGVVIVHSRQYARKEINKKLTPFSFDFKRFVAIKPDNKIKYILNNYLANEDILYKLPSAKIVSVKFNDDAKNPVVYIQTIY